MSVTEFQTFGAVAIDEKSVACKIRRQRRDEVFGYGATWRKALKSSGGQLLAGGLLSDPDVFQKFWPRPNHDSPIATFRGQILVCHAKAKFGNSCQMRAFGIHSIT